MNGSCARDRTRAREQDEEQEKEPVAGSRASQEEPARVRGRYYVIAREPRGTDCTTKGGCRAKQKARTFTQIIFINRRAPLRHTVCDIILSHNTFLYLRVHCNTNTSQIGRKIKNRTCIKKYFQRQKCTLYIEYSYTRLFYIRVLENTYVHSFFYPDERYKNFRSIIDIIN